MPDEFKYQCHVQDEAWTLMMQGRIMYTELPTCLTTRPHIVMGDPRSEFLSFNMDPDLAYTVGMGYMQKPRPPPVYWIKRYDENGEVYYYNEMTKETCFEDPSTPEGSERGVYVVNETDNLVEQAEKDYYDFLSDKHDDEDARETKEKIQHLQIRVTELEKIQRTMRKYRAKTKEKNTIKKEDDAAERAKEKKEYERVKAMTDPKHAAYMKQKEDKYKAEMAILRGGGNVFSRGTVDDVIDLLERQKRRKNKQVMESATAAR